jgi:hypothetical protein
MSCCVAGLGTVVVGVKVSLCASAECYCATVNSEEGHVGPRPLVFHLGCTSLESLYSGRWELRFQI